jgi:hypothetical protein
MKTQHTNLIHHTNHKSNLNDVSNATRYLCMQYNLHNQ